MVNRSVVVALASILLSGCWGAEPLRVNVPRSEFARSIENSLPEQMKENGLPALTVAVIRNGDIELTRSFGFADALSQIPVSEQTVFEVASLGKPVFAYLVAKLASNGLFDLDVPLTQYVPGLFTRPDPRLETITARMILSHSSGLPNFGTDDPEKLMFDPGSGFQYSGVGISRLQTMICLLYTSDAADD